MPFKHGFFGGKTELDAEIIVSTLRKRIPISLSTLTVRYVSASSEVTNTMKVLADLKHQGIFSQLKIIRLNFCRYTGDPWFPSVPYSDLGADAIELFGEILEEAGLQLEIAQTD